VTSRPHCVQIRGFGVIQQLDIVGPTSEWPVYSGRNMIGAVLVPVDASCLVNRFAADHCANNLNVFNLRFVHSEDIIGKHYKVRELTD